MPTELHVYNVVTQVWSDDPRVHLLLHATLCYMPKGYFFAPAYKNGSWDGYKRLYYSPINSRPFGKFWTGLLHRAHTILETNGIEHQILDKRVAPQPGSPLPIDAEDRGYQGDAVTVAVPKTRGIIKVATAGGKTTIAAKIMAHLNLPSVFVVHRDNLVKQATASFARSLGMEIGIIQGDNIKLRQFNVATVQTLDSRLWQPTESELRAFINDRVQLLLVDEVHHAVSDSWRRVIEQHTSAYFRYGFTATVKEGPENMMVEGCFGRVIYEAERVDLTAKGYLARAHVFAI